MIRLHTECNWFRLIANVRHAVPRWSAQRSVLGCASRATWSFQGYQNFGILKPTPDYWYSPYYRWRLPGCRYQPVLFGLSFIGSVIFSADNLFYQFSVLRQPISKIFFPLSPFRTRVFEIKKKKSGIFSWTRVFPFHYLKKKSEFSLKFAFLISACGARVFFKKV